MRSAALMIATTLATAGVARAQEQPPADALSPTSIAEPPAALEEVQPPFASRDIPAERAAAGEAAWEHQLAESAARAGVFSVAESFFRSALAREKLPADLQHELTLGLAGALISQNKRVEAAQLLEQYGGPRDAAWQLRRAAVHFMHASDRGVPPEEVAAEYLLLEKRLSLIEPGALSAADEPWRRFLRAMVLLRKGPRKEADDTLQSAVDIATPAQAAIFRLAEFTEKILEGDASAEMAEQLQAELRSRNIKPDDYFRAGRVLAVVLDRLGRSDEAIALLTTQLRNVPQPTGLNLDQTRLLLALIAGAQRPEGWTAFVQTLRSSGQENYQRAALIRLSAAATPGDAQRLRDLKALIAEIGPQQPELADELLLFSAELALRERNYLQAEEFATQFRERFPGSPLGNHALAVLASSAWQRGHYRTAGELVGQLAANLANGPATSGADRARLQVLLAECFYRAGIRGESAGDFSNAAGAYEKALAGFARGERPLGISAGTLFFQRVTAAARAGEFDAAEQALNDLPRSPVAAAVDTESRWQAEWNFIRHLRLSSSVEAQSRAYRRVESLAPDVSAPPELRLRFLWLRALLAFESSAPATGATAVTEIAQRGAQVLQFLGETAGGEIDAELRKNVAAHVELLMARAQLKSGDAAAGLRALEQVRTKYAGSAAAEFSYMVEAQHLAAANKLVEAQTKLIYLADNFPRSPYAAPALYQAASLAERRGQSSFLHEASRLLSRLANEYPQHPIVFAALMRQADLQRLLNQFSEAEFIYRHLETQFPNHPERPAAELRLAQTLLAQAPNDPSKFEGAVTRLDRLFYSAAPVDLRVEAGYLLAFAWQTRGNAERAARYFWDVREQFLGDAETAARLTSGRYWLGRSLRGLAELLEKTGRPAEARRCYQEILDFGLPGEHLARGLLNRHAVGAATPTSAP